MTGGRGVVGSYLDEKKDDVPLRQRTVGKREISSLVDIS